MKKEIDFKRKKWILIGVGICVAVCAALLFTPIFNVDKVLCQGNVRIAYEEIESAAKVERKCETDKFSGGNPKTDFW